MLIYIRIVVYKFNFFIYNMQYIELANIFNLNTTKTVPLHHKNAFFLHKFNKLIP